MSRKYKSDNIVLMDDVRNALTKICETECKNDPTTPCVNCHLASALDAIEELPYVDGPDPDDYY